MSIAQNWKKCLDLIEDGVIVVDLNKTIEVYNKRAREIFGIDMVSGEGHPYGHVAVGDIVVLADNCLGGDDGGLLPEDLSLMGIPPRAARTGDAIIAVGRYKTPYEKPYYKVAADGNMQAPLSLGCCINKMDKLDVTIDDFTKNISIRYNGKNYDLGYQISIGHLVIIDGITGEVKFYQGRGYTARGEDTRHILMGKEFAPKCLNNPSPALIGQPLGNIHPDNQVANYLDLILSGRSRGVEQREYFVNGIWVRLSGYPLFNQNGQIIGGTLIFRDINELKLLEKQVQNKGFKYPAFQAVKGDSPVIMEAIRMAQRVSKSKSTVLLLGESGTGKGLFAKSIHKNSSRADKPFVIVNTAAIPSNLLESELFGYTDGAFTGAAKGGKEGKFRMAHGGTIFLDEIGEMDFYLQAKILHVLQDEHFYPLGSSRPVKIDVRVIAATNKDLEQEVKKGRFREDLYYRLNVVSITIPPLRQRKGDIGELINSILPVIKDKVGRKDMVIAPEVLDDLYFYDWPGNVRELENVLERAANIAEGNTITRTSIPAYISGKINRPAADRDITSLQEYMDIMEKEAIIRVLKETGYNKTMAIKRLDIGRTAFYKKIKQYNIPLQPHVP